jgi:hypothetical protein
MARPHKKVAKPAKGFGLGLALRNARLTDKQQQFVTCVANGRTLLAAYRASYNTEASDKVVGISANALMKTEKIAMALQAQLLQRQDIPKNTLDEIEVRNYLIAELMEISRQSKDDSVRIKALEILADTVGVNSVSVE